jgi:hypothetical protein
MFGKRSISGAYCHAWPHALVPIKYVYHENHRNCRLAVGRFPFAALRLSKAPDCSGESRRTRIAAGRGGRGVSLRRGALYLFQQAACHTARLQLFDMQRDRLFAPEHPAQRFHANIGEGCALVLSLWYRCGGASVLQALRRKELLPTAFAPRLLERQLSMFGRRTSADRDHPAV